MIHRVLMPIAAGSRVGPYEIVHWLGAGGMGEVYRARDPRLTRDVAIKLIPDAFATDRNRLDRFEQEARAIGRLNHPNILAVYDVGTHEGSPYIVSELLEGESLRSRLRGMSVTWRKAIDYARQIADGLAAAHDKNIVHRDIKPDNLFITNAGRVKILDFGIAKLTQPAYETDPRVVSPTDTADGRVVGTAAYMSPEQLRGEAVDARSDIFSFGAVLYEMLVGRPAFGRATPAETSAAILKEDAESAMPPTVPAALERIVSRCLEKAREARFQSARDLAFALEFFPSTSATGVRTGFGAVPRNWRAALGPAIVALSLVVAAASWLMRPRVQASDDPLADATFTPFTNWDGTEEGAEISPDGKLVAFLSDRDGEFDVWLSQVGTGRFTNLTRSIPPLAAMGFIVRKLGFSGDGADLWFNPADNRPLLRMPWASEGTPRAFLPVGSNTPAWSPDGVNLVYVYKAGGDDPMFLADHTGADPRVILPPGREKVMNPVWSSDGQWIYYTRGVEPLQDEMTMDIWRVRPSGGTPERLTKQSIAANFLAPVDGRTLLYVGRSADRSGPWLWAFDVERQTTRRVTKGVEQYTSVSSSRDGRRIVATVANPSATVWRIPLLDHRVEERDAERYPLPEPTGLTRSPRFSRLSMFFIASRGQRDGIWKLENGSTSEVWSDVDGGLSEPAAISPDGARLAVVVRREGKRRLMIMSSDGTGARTLAPSVEIEGAPGQGAADWSPDGTQIVAGGRDTRGPALFLIPADGGDPRRLREGQWGNPVWSPRNDLIVYAGRSLIGQVTLLGIRPDGSPVDFPPVMTRPGGYRFLPSGAALVYVPRIPSLDFWLLDLASKNTRQITGLGNQGALRTFDITHDGKYIVFDRSRQNANIVLIERPGS